MKPDIELELAGAVRSTLDFFRRRGVTNEQIKDVLQRMLRWINEAEQDAA